MLQVHLENGKYILGTKIGLVRADVFTLNFSRLEIKEEEESL